MTEIRIKRNQIEEEFAKYSKAVQRYHRYGVYVDDLSGKKDIDEHYVAEVKKRQLIILAGMNEDEYRELQTSLENHIVQKRIYLDQQYKELIKLAEESLDGKIYTYCVESCDDGLCSPLAVFNSNELDEARRYAREAYENRTDDCTIQISEGLFDSEGNMLGNTMIAFVLESWGD